MAWPRSPRSAAWSSNTKWCSIPIACALTTAAGAVLRMAIQNANQEVGGSVIELAEAEYMVRSRGYLQRIGTCGGYRWGERHRHADPARRRGRHPARAGVASGAAELDGEGEVVGGIIMMRAGENALTTIEGVKAKLEQLRRGLPEGVDIVPTYDRSDLILRAVKNLGEKLVEEFVVVVIVCAVFLFHLRSSLVILISLPIGDFGRLRHHALAGHQRQYPVTGRHRHRHWRHGRCRHCHDRESAQAFGTGSAAG